MRLAHQHVTGATLAGPRRRAVFLHGILGHGSNLRTLARRFVTARDGWDAWTVDLRGHAASHKGSPDPTLAAAAHDVVESCAASDVPVALLVGHSFGGKVALAAAREEPGALTHVVTLDSPPGARPPERGGDSALAVIEMLRGLPDAFSSRDDFVKAVIAQGHTPVLASWLAMSTVHQDGQATFALDLREIEALILDYFAADLWPFVATTALPVHFVVGERSSSWSPAELERARALAPRVTVDTLPAGHWVHAEDPDGVVRALLEHIPS